MVLFSFCFMLNFVSVRREVWKAWTASVPFALRCDSWSYTGVQHWAVWDSPSHWCLALSTQWVSITLPWNLTGQEESCLWKGFVWHGELLYISLLFCFCSKFQQCRGKKGKLASVVLETANSAEMLLFLLWVSAPKTPAPWTFCSDGCVCVTSESLWEM